VTGFPVTDSGKLKAHIEITRPDTQLGEKVRDAHSKAGRTRAKYFKEKIRDCLKEIEEYCKANTNVSITAARERIAKKYSLSRRTIERHSPRSR